MVHAGSRKCRATGAVSQIRCEDEEICVGEQVGGGQVSGHLSAWHAVVRLLLTPSAGLATSSLHLGRLRDAQSAFHTVQPLVGNLRGF